VGFAEIIGLAVLTVAAAGGSGFTETRAAEPDAPAAVFRNKNFSLVDGDDLPHRPGHGSAR